MKFDFTILLLLSASIIAHAETGAEVPVHPELRRAALIRFTYSDPTPKDGPDPMTIGTPRSEPVDVDIVVMKKMSITDRLDRRELARDILKTRPLAGHSDTKLGTGVLEKDFGKIRASALTVLYIPIQVGVSW